MISLRGLSFPWGGREERERRDGPLGEVEAHALNAARERRVAEIGDDRRRFGPREAHDRARRAPGRGGDGDDRPGADHDPVISSSCVP